MSSPKVVLTPIAVEHVTITSPLSFAQVRQQLEQSLPKLDPRIAEHLASGDAAAASAYQKNGPALSIFLERDHGALLAIAGQARNAIQYEIGNPLTASTMTRHRLSAALYAPLRIVLWEDSDGHAVIEYDKPSSLFGQFGDAEVTEVGRYLDHALETALLTAAGRNGPANLVNLGAVPRAW
jgi:uncharacterized protein (DUF302 family)